MDFRTTTYLNSTTGLNYKFQETLAVQLSITNKGEETEFRNTVKNGVKSLHTNTEQLSEKEKDYIERLEKRESEVREHEKAHMRSAGTLTNGGANYEYKIGPDGKRYVVGGNVSIDTSPVPNDPEATVEKAQKIKKAALAPANPSPKDRQVATAATRMEQQAKLELSKKKKDESENSNNNAGIKEVNNDFGINVYDALGRVEGIPDSTSSLNLML